MTLQIKDLEKAQSALHLGKWTLILMGNTPRETHLFYDGKYMDYVQSFSIDAIAANELYRISITALVPPESDK